MNSQASEGTNPEMEGSLAVDHALLESLFFNEMMMLNPSSPGPSSFLTQHFSDVAYAKPPQPEATSDPNTLAEKEMLRDFGVTSPSAYCHHVPPEVAPSTDTLAPTWEAQPSHLPQHAYIAPAGPALEMGPAQAPYSSRVPSPIAYRPHPPPVYAKATPAHAQWPPLSVDTSLPPPHHHSQDRAKLLVDQFATLASRLGIELPNNVLQSLTAAAAKNDPELAALAPRSAPLSSSSLDLKKLADTSVPPLDEDSSDSGPSTLNESRKPADESVTSVSKKRPSDTEDNLYANGVSKHGKRKKKPRLADCESRLAELRAENELLKRHLENVSNKAHRFDQEKEAAGKRIHALLEQNAGQDEMNAAVREFTEMYSDYGKNREKELNFHLEQLQRYAKTIGTRVARQKLQVFLVADIFSLHAQTCQSDQLYKNGALDTWSK
jgi:hypothetical protein